MEQEKRSAVIELFCTGHQSKDIAKLLNYHPKTVYRIIQRYKDMGTSQRKDHIPRGDKKRSLRFVAGLKKSIKANPSTPMSVLTKNCNVSVSTISRAVRDNLGHKSFILRVRHLLTYTMREKRMDKCRKIVNSMKSTGGHLQFFSDEEVLLWTCLGTGRMTGGSARSLLRSTWCSGPSTWLLSWS